MLYVTRLMTYFYPRPPYGGRRDDAALRTPHHIFLSTPSVRRATTRPPTVPSYLAISIHALRTEGDSKLGVFSSETKYFYPRPPYGGRHRLDQAQVAILIISIHALRTEGDRDDAAFRTPHHIFLSTPSVRRATHAKCQANYPEQFLSTPSVRRATQPHQKKSPHLPISIHALRTEGDRLVIYPAPEIRHFYPRPPYGGRR